MRYWLLLVLLLSPAIAAAQEQQQTTDEDPLLSVSIGQSQLFAPSTLEADIKQLVPTQSVMFLLEWYLPYALRAVSAFNLPTRPILRFVDGELVQEFAPSSLSAGVAWAPLSIKFQERRAVEFELGVLGGMTFERRPAFFPLVAGRVLLLHKSDLALYVGGAFAARRSTTALLYGVGYRF